MERVHYEKHLTVNILGLKYINKYENEDVTNFFAT